MSRSRTPGLTASTASALASSTATQPGPLSAQAMSTMSERGILRPWATRSAIGFLYRPAADQRRRRERQARLGPPDRDQPGPALLDHGVRVGRPAAGLQPGMAGPQRGMPGERQFPGRGEDPDQVIGPGVARRQHERGLRQVRPVRELLHLLVGKPVRAEHDRDRVAEIRGIGEDVHLTKLIRHTPSLGGGAAPAAGPIPPPLALPARSLYCAARRLARSAALRAA